MTGARPDDSGALVELQGELRRQLLPRIPDLIFAGSMQLVGIVTTNLFLVAFDVCVSTLAAGVDFEEFRSELQCRAAQAAFCLELVIAGCDAPHEARSHVRAILAVFYARVEGDEIPEDAMDDGLIMQAANRLWETYVRDLYKRLGAWDPAEKRSQAELVEIRRARVARFTTEMQVRGILVIPATIYRSADIDHSSYYAWTKGERSDAAAASIAIEAVLAARTPLKK